MVRLTSVYGATNEVEPGEVVNAPIIAIESLRVQGVELVYGDFHIFKVWGMEREPALIIGMDVLGTVATLLARQSLQAQAASGRVTLGGLDSAMRELNK